MLQITDKSKCCGCNACVQRCPKQCIVMHEDEEGFLYPQVDVTLCVDCGLCEKVCPMLAQNDVKKALQIFAAKNKNEHQRLRSSSGGIFILLAEQTIKMGGVVFGARFDKNWEVEHCYVETIEELEPLMRSKYVQSRIGNTYKEAEQFLKEGRRVLFVGTSCQILGLHKFLRKDYNNLLSVDFICHGVPSPKVWRIYLNKIVADCYGVHPKSDRFYKKYLQKVEFRSKIKGWKNFRYRMVLLKTKRNGKKKMFTYSSAFSENAYMQMFLSDLILRPSCYKCPSKAGKSGSDMTIGDFWGIEKVVPQFDDDKGISLLIINNSRFIPLLSEVQFHFECLKLPFNVIPQYNKSFLYSVKEPLERDRFFLLLYKGDDFFSFGRLVWAKNRKVSLISKINRLCVWLKKLVS